MPHGLRWWWRAILLGDFLFQSFCVELLALFAWLGWFGYLQLADERLLEITSESLNVPQWLYTVCIPVGCAMIIGRILVTVVDDLRGVK